MPIRPSAFLSEHGTDSAPTGRIFMKFDIWSFFQNKKKRVEKIEVSFNMTRIAFTLREDQCTFMVSLIFEHFYKKKKVEKIQVSFNMTIIMFTLREDQCTFMVMEFLSEWDKIKRIICSTVFPLVNRAAYQIMWKNIVEWDRM
jgi:hypothetical protein